MTESLPTEARIAQKARLKQMAEKGEKPKKRKQVVEDGHDDCGDDVSGLGPDVHLLGSDCACYSFDYMTECWDSEPEIEVLPSVSSSSGSGSVTAPGEHRPIYTPPAPVDPNLKIVRPR